MLYIITNMAARVASEVLLRLRGENSHFSYTETTRASLKTRRGPWCPVVRHRMCRSAKTPRALLMMGSVSEKAAVVATLFGPSNGTVGTSNSDDYGVWQVLSHYLEAGKRHYVWDVPRD